MMSYLINVLVAFLAFSPLASLVPNSKSAHIINQIQQQVFAAVPNAIRAASPDALPYPLAEMGYTHTIDGRDVKLSGTAESIIAQIRSLDVTFSFNSTLAELQEANLLARGTDGKYAGNVLCCPVAGWGWGGATVQAIFSGIDYLQGLSGGCHLGPKSCSRVSCSYNSGIYFCNDNHYDISPTCSYLASYAIDLINDCATHPGNFGVPTVCGQEFDSDGYNVIVHSDDC